MRGRGETCRDEGGRIPCCGGSQELHGRGAGSEKGVAARLASSQSYEGAKGGIYTMYNKASSTALHIHPDPL